MYFIPDWDQHFENTRSKTIKNMRWAKIPNDLDGDEYTTIMIEEDGLEIYGCWVLIVLVASRCQERGTLMRKNGIGHDARSLSRLTRVHASIFERAIPKLIEIGWLAHKIHESDTEMPPLCLEKAIEGKGREGKGREGIEEKTTLSASQAQRTLEFEDEDRIPGEPDSLEFTIPANLPGKRFEDAWEDWQIYRAQRGKKLTTRLAARQLKQLSLCGVDRAVNAILDAMKAEGLTLQPRKPTEEMIAKIYQAYPRKAKPREARKAIEKALNLIDFETLLKKTQRYAFSPKVRDNINANTARFIPHPASWFNGGSYDEPETEWGYSQTQTRIHSSADGSVNSAEANKKQREVYEAKLAEIRADTDRRYKGNPHTERLLGMDL